MSVFSLYHLTFLSIFNSCLTVFWAFKLNNKKVFIILLVENGYTSPMHFPNVHHNVNTRTGIFFYIYIVRMTTMVSFPLNSIKNNSTHNEFSSNLTRNSFKPDNCGAYKNSTYQLDVAKALDRWAPRPGRMVVGTLGRQLVRHTQLCDVVRELSFRQERDRTRDL